MADNSSQNQIRPVNQGTPIYNYGVNPSYIKTTNGQEVSVQPSNITYPYYQYPTASLYDTNQKQAASGVNIYIYNPSAIGGPTSTSTASANYANATPPQEKAAAFQPLPSQPIANTPISYDNNVNIKAQDGEKKQVVNLTNDYIKTLESYLRSADKNVRKNGITDLIKRFEEDTSRYNNPALTALLNIALQDPDETNRMLAMSPIASGSAHGDKNSAAILQNLQNSDKMYGQEAKMASEALLNTSQTTKEVPDNSQKEKKE